MKFALVSSLMLSLVAVASAVPSGFRGKSTPVLADRSNPGSLDTNAKRLAAGLPPLPARKLWSPTSSAKRWSTSPVPHQVKLGITAKNGTKLGFISKFLNVNGEYTIGVAPEDAAVISFAAPKNGKATKLSLKDQTSTSPNATFFAALIPRTYNLTLTPDGSSNIFKRDGTAANQTDHVTIAGTAQTAPDSTPQNVPNTVQQSSNGTLAGSGGNGGGSAPSGPNGNNTLGSGADGESAIWNYDPSTGQWTATWINYDGSAVDTTPYFNPSSSANVSSIALVSDTQTYEANNPQAFAITFGSQ